MSEEDVIDDEILEIFVEEAAEVLETINEFFPQWRDDPDNTEARVEVRRAFHTLKGSGRMVRATEVAELAWSVENMLNRIIDGSVATSEKLFLLISKVIDVLPGMVKLFEDKQPQELNVEPLMDAANQFSEGGQPDVDNLSLGAEAAPAVATAAVTTAAAADEEDDMDKAFKEEVTAKLEDLAKTVRELSLSVRGLTSELPNMKTKIRDLEARPQNSPVNTQSLSKDMLANKQEIGKIGNQLQNELKKVHEEIHKVQHSLRLEIDNNSKKLNLVSSEMTKNLDQARWQGGNIKQEIKMWAIGAAVTVGVVVLALSAVLS